MTSTNPTPTYLQNLNPHPRDQHITFDEGPHIYTVHGDSSFTSVTTWNHTHFPPFEEETLLLLLQSLTTPTEMNDFNQKGECTFKTHVKDFSLRCKVEKKGGVILRIQINSHSTSSPNLILLFNN